MNQLPEILKNKKIRILTHVLFWIIILVYYTFFFGHQQGFYFLTFKFVILLMPITIGTTYFFNYFLIPRYLLQNKIGQFLSNYLIRNIVGQVKSSFDVREIMDEGKILIMNLSKGRIGEDTAQLIGAMMITQIQLAAMTRVDIPEEERKDFFLYVDEFQNFATDSFAGILSEARKYHLNLIMAHQYIDVLFSRRS